MKNYAIWVCPALCGCKISMVANFNVDELINGESFRHPAPFSIDLGSMIIVSVCPPHEHFKTDDLPADPYGGCPGYIKLPIANPTEAQKLYIQLYQFTAAQGKPDTCGCEIYEVRNRITDEVQYVEHPVHTKRCTPHLNDLDHSIALGENRLKNETESHLLESLASHTEVDENGSKVWKKGVKYDFRFDENRKLKVNIKTTLDFVSKGGSTVDKNDLQSVLDIKFSNKVDAE